MNDHDTYECLLCGTRFEAGVADADDDRPRCPQCFMSFNRLVDAGDHAQPVITCTTNFR